jgi:murein DD-endopeptidase MepM/ murein hydrolase activator NlpD
LNILPVDGVIHTVEEGDTLEKIAFRHGVSVEDIVQFIGNGFDLLPPFEISPGQQLVVPGGRNPVVWVEPGPPVVPGMGRKSPGLYSGPLVNIGTGYFIWPIAPPLVLTQEFWGGHPAIDLDTYNRQPIFASDSGTVIFSGWSDTGYGNLVIVDHGNGYWTYYAHNEANLVSVGQGVVQGQQIAESGSTGNSTGDHLDFRIRIDGGSFLNPKEFLP